MAEIWKEITGYEGLYQVSNLGNVRRIKHIETNRNGVQRILGDKNLARRIDGKGYFLVSLSKDGKQKTRRIHRLVAEMFVPNPNNYPQVNHKDENKQNNQENNLEWCTNRYNSNYGNRCQNISKTIRLWWEKRKQQWLIRNCSEIPNNWMTRSAGRRRLKRQTASLSEIQAVTMMW